MSNEGNGAKRLHLLLILALCVEVYSVRARHVIRKRNYSDQSVRGYLAERTCWWNEVCKEEFHSKFRCRCPRWSYCRAPGRYYDARCSMTRTGYIWTQPEASLTLQGVRPPNDCTSAFGARIANNVYYSCVLYDNWGNDVLEHSNIGYCWNIPYNIITWLIVNQCAMFVAIVQ